MGSKLKKCIIDYKRYEKVLELAKRRMAEYEKFMSWLIDFLYEDFDRIDDDKLKNEILKDQLKHKLNLREEREHKLLRMKIREYILTHEDIDSIFKK